MDRGMLLKPGELSVKYFITYYPDKVREVNDKKDYVELILDKTKSFGGFYGRVLFKK